VALTIQELFKTKITAMAMSPASMEQMVIFVDESRNRWIMVVDHGCAEVETDSSGLNRICMFFPRANTPVCVQGVPTPLKPLNDPALRKGCLALVVCDVAEWNKEWGIA
jgi:hypothetical protein